MPIDVTCPCGLKARVREELAGKKAKCADCGKVMKIPVPAVSDAEESAYALLSEADSPVVPADPQLSTQQKALEIPRRSEPPAAKQPAKTRAVGKIRYERKEESYSGPPRIVMSPGFAAALGSVLFGSVIVAIRVGSGQIPIYGVIMLCGGLIRLVNGLLGKEED